MYNPPCPLRSQYVLCSVFIEKLSVGTHEYILREIHPCAEKNGTCPRSARTVAPLIPGTLSPSSHRPSPSPWSTNVCFACLDSLSASFVLFDIHERGHSYHDVLITPLRSRYTSQTRGSLARIGVMDCIAAPVTRLPVFTASPQLGNLRLLLFLFLFLLFLFFSRWPDSIHEPGDGKAEEEGQRGRREKKRTKRKISADRGMDGDTGIRSGCVVQEEAPEAANLKANCGEEKFYLRPWQWHRNNIIGLTTDATRGA